MENKKTECPFKVNRGFPNCDKNCELNIDGHCSFRLIAEKIINLAPAQK